MQIFNKIISVFLLVTALLVCGVGFGQTTIYNADFSTNDDGFPDHDNDSGTSLNEPLAGSQSVGPFGASPNSWSLSYDTAPNTDGSANSFKVVNGSLESDDWGGQGIFESQVIDVCNISTVDITAASVNSGANDNNFKYFYILDGGARAETSNISSSNGNSVNYNITSLDVSSNTTLVVGFEFSENGEGQGYKTSEFKVTGISSGGNLNPVISNISQNPSTDITSSDAVSVSANITDCDGTINNVDLNWGTTSGNLSNTINMSNTSGDTYGTDSSIPSQTEGISVFYEITATDNDAGTTISSEQDYTVAFSLPFIDDFNSGLYTVTQGGVGSNGTTDTDYFFITDGTNITPNYTNTDGNFFAGQDIDDDGWTGSASPSELTWSNIDISGITDIVFSCDFASEGGGIDATDFLLFEYRIDSGIWIDLIAFENTGGTNNNFLEDINFNGTGNGTQLTANFTTFTKDLSVSGSRIDIRFTANINSGGEEFAIDNLDIREPNDRDSKITAPITQVPASTIVSDEVNTITVSEPVLRFDVEDLGSEDGVPTKINQISFVPGPNNTADWSDVIQGIRVNAGGTNIDGTETKEEVLNGTEMTYSFDHDVTNISNNMIIDDGTTKEFEIRVYLNESNIVGGEVIQLQIEQNNTKFQTENSGSGLETTFDASITGNQHTISIPSKALSFIQQPQTTVINENMNFNVQVAYVDNNGNVNNEETTDIKITSGGSMIGNPITKAPVDGISTFIVNHDALASNITLTASTSISSIIDLVSNNFSIIEAVQLFITEVVNPDESGGDGKYIEIFNAGLTSIDFTSNDYYIVSEANGGARISNIQLTGQIEAKGYYTIGDGNFNSKYGFNPDIVGSGNVGQTVSGNGNDSYFISINVNDGNDGKNSVVDIYGEIGINGFTGDNSTDDNNSSTIDDTDWEYEDSRAYRLNPEVKKASSVWDNTEWQITSPGSIATIEPTPEYGDQDYIYDGAWTNTGIKTNPDGVSTGSQNIFIRSGNVSFNSDTTIGDLVVRSGATITIKAGVKLTVTGDIVNEGEIIFESTTATNSAVLESVAPNTRVVGSGFEIHRYIPNSNRAFRYLSPSVTTTGSAKPTINDNWQEGANNTSQSDANNQNPNPGFGTHITGSTVGDKGFDATSTGNSSMFEWNESGQSWQSIPNTDVKTFNAGEAYAILIRGDRATTLNSNTALGNPTTLRTEGRIHVGDFELTEVDGDLTSSDNPNGNFNLVGNPYQSQVDLKDLLDNHSTDINNNVAYIYDPTLGDRGGYATIDLLNNTISPVPNGTSANQYLQPNQAFFVESNGTSPTITFIEDVKNNDNPQVGTFSNNNLSRYLNFNLKDNLGKLIDGVRVMYNENYSNIIDDYDAVKAWNFDESMTVFSKGKELSIEKRQYPTSADTTEIHLYNYTKTDYTIEAEFVSDFLENQNMFLFDKYTQNSVEIIPNQLVNHDFTVNPNIPESISNDRFLIIYDQTTLSTIDHRSNLFAVYPNPLRSNILKIKRNSSNIEGIKHVELFNIQGQKILDFKEEELIKLGGLIELEIKEKLSSGSYFIKITTSNTNYYEKIIIN